MIRSLWIAKTGMEAQQTQLDVTSHNLANVSTTGFKKSRAVFEDLLYQNIRQPGGQSSQQTNLPSGMQQGTGVRPVAIERIHTQGNPQATGNDKDIMVNGAGFFNVLLPDGTTAYTRDGSFQRDNNGQMVTSSGFVLQPPITIPIEAQNITVGRDGTVSALVPGTVAPQQLGALQLSTFINPTGLESKGENLYVETGASGAPQTNTPGTNGLGAILQGYVESSNVNVVEEMVNMIQSQRAYEINSKAITTSDQMLARLSQL
ncbi:MULTISPECIES: flagellar basal-body rod protein FlgG [Duganella]|jgi:flagellar basal-body rod protein FlgG|uniref:Flagellar basal-body rod protein FlgG n=1 Tax=Duganella zoogloeoides TaxID=75659 RepID=A0ABZ0Y1F4_9BURK|nr:MULTISPECIES: flagellar basal-body rod protein FlgG [Duganella]KQN75492.1 flagellar basal-body rod protein FlgG [Duganella sp. Leaf61]MPQ56963.1 flagellar basal-body rod protein FlgG [Duganella sp. FT27W]WQH05691.1 flagellar basal-body rod protein FlgG [Duganella zoogloeoides]